MLDVIGYEAFGTYNGKTLMERLAGRFYTPDLAARDLAARMIEASSLPRPRKVRLADPFCGDGRLIVALLHAASDHPRLSQASWTVELRDRETSAVRLAERSVRIAATALGMKVDVVAFVGDTFASDLTSRFDFVITNPPWELLKPDRREMSAMSIEDASSYRSRLKRHSQQLDTRFPHSRGEGAWGGWGTNLARCGWDLCASIVKTGGVVGILLPSTLLADQSSAPLRKHLLCRHSIVDVASYPSEARLFDRVDQPVSAITMVAGRSIGSAQIRMFGANRHPVSMASIDISVDVLAKRKWTLPVGFGAGAENVLQRLSGLPTMRDLEGDAPNALWLGRELDETRIVDKIMKGKKFPFIKGRGGSANSDRTISGISA